MRILLALGLINLGIGVFGASFYFTEKFIQRGTIERIEGTACVNGKVGYVKTSANNKKEIVFPRNQNNQPLLCLHA
jgi:hypothetical protein